MPVDSQYGEVHPLTAGGSLYGCHSKPRTAKHYWAPQRIVCCDGSFDVISGRVPVATSKACRSFYLWDTDAMCAGCTTEKDIEYAERMKGMV